MKKKIAAFLIMVMMLGVLGGCSKDTDAGYEEPGTNPETAKEIVRLVTEDIPGCSTKRDSAVEAYNDFFASEGSADINQWLATLTDAKTEYEEYISELDSIEVHSADAQELKSLYEKSAKLQYDAMNDIVIALSEYDSSYFDTANEKMSESRNALRDYEDKVKEKAGAFGITLK